MSATLDGTSGLAQTYYAALNRGELLVQRCGACATHSMYPRTWCPSCHEQALDWVVSTGRGRLYSFTVQRAGAPDGFEDELPYGLGVVRLTEEVQVLGRLQPDASGGFDAYRTDATVELCAPGPISEGADRPPAPWFRLREEGS